MRTFDTTIGQNVSPFSPASDLKGNPYLILSSDYMKGFIWDILRNHPTLERIWFWAETQPVWVLWILHCLYCLSFWSVWSFKTIAIVTNHDNHNNPHIIIMISSSQDRPFFPSYSPWSASVPALSIPLASWGKGWYNNNNNNNYCNNNNNNNNNNKNDRPGDDGTLRSVYLLVFLLGVIDLASPSS